MPGKQSDHNFILFWKKMKKNEKVLRIAWFKKCYPPPKKKKTKNQNPTPLSRILGWYGPWFLRGAQIWLFLFGFLWSWWDFTHRIIFGVWRWFPLSVDSLKWIEWKCIENMSIFFRGVNCLLYFTKFLDLCKAQTLPQLLEWLEIFFDTFVKKIGNI